ncbi:mutS protein homolog 4-like [Littorina saxatilis]|uniref:mutS protein homolog 4-like n=1 Tax=Littorina saxatilis TaxID=31220 RepID=UPI0038B62164
MNGKQAKAAKYSFGLLETPDTCTSSTSSTSSSSKNDGSTSSTTLPHAVQKVSTETSTGTAQPYTSSSNASGNAKAGTSSSRSSSIQTPARFTGGSFSSRSKTPGTFKTPRTPGTFKTPRTPAARRTPRTPYTSGSMTPAMDSASSVIVAIVEGRGLARGEIGMASIDLKSPVLTMSQFSDTPRYSKTINKLQILKPLEIVLPNTACESGNATKLFQMISEQFQNSTISTVQRRYFNETKGLQYINQLCLSDYRTVEMEVAAKYYCLATAAALLKYVEFIQNITFAPSSLKVVFKGGDHTTMIDAVTARNLELLENLRDPKSSHTLYGVLNYTRTPGGARMLRSNILQPSSDLETVTMRQDVVRELTEKAEVFYNLEGVMGKFLDVDHIISHCVQIAKQDCVKVAESNINTVICLKHVLGLVPVLCEFLKDCENPLLKAYCKALEDARFELIMSKINLIIHEDTKYQKGTLPMRIQKCFAVKPGVNGLLDVARRAYTEIVDDLSDMIKQLGKQYNLPLKSAFSTVRGFYIQLYCGGKNSVGAKDLPPVFIKVTKYKNTLNFTTADLIRLNDRIKSSLDEIFMMTNIVMKELLASVREFMSVLYNLSEIVANLDVLLAFAHACTLSSYVCPEFTDTLAIKMGRHPVLEKIGDTVPNNTYAAEDCNFVVITGPNMSGKSTYLRQVALLQIMAQIGSFVPAEYASFRLTSHIFSRVGSDDDMETNSSTFTLEMKEMNYITQNSTNNSLIIIDELGRGTSAEEGVGICWAICEYLLKTKAFTFFVTHFKDITTMDHLYANVENYFFEVQRTFSREGSCEKITYTHVLSRGKTPEQHYGLKLAEMSTMPVDVLRDAQQLAHHLDTLRQTSEAVDPEVANQRAVFKLATKLIQLARNSRLEEGSLRAYLTSLQQQYSQHNDAHQQNPARQQQEQQAVSGGSQQQVRPQQKQTRPQQYQREVEESHPQKRPQHPQQTRPQQYQRDVEKNERQHWRKRQLSAMPTELQQARESDAQGRDTDLHQSQYPHYQQSQQEPARSEVGGAQHCDKNPGKQTPIENQRHDANVQDLAQQPQASQNTQRNDEAQSQHQQREVIPTPQEIYALPVRRQLFKEHQGKELEEQHYPGEH